MIFVIILFNSFSNYYPNTNYDYISVSNPISTVSNLGIWVENVFFCHFNSKTIQLINFNVKILLEKSIFWNCSSIGNGGAIYIDSSQTDCILNKICSNFCFTNNNYGEFCYIKVGNSKKNYFYFNSIIYCNNNIQSGMCSFNLNYGNQNISNLNSSYNFKQQCSGQMIENSPISKIVFSTYSSNKVKNMICIDFHSGTYQFEYCNIINNTNSQSSSWGIIYAYSSTLTIYKCSIFLNSPTNLFNSNSANILIDSCWIQNYINNGAIITNLITITYYHLIYHYNTNFCFAKNPINLQTSQTKILNLKYLIYFKILLL